ncbi:hypothetical protein DSO57_1006710 [Entomophthora muscae]|uniref:Uncharacterized protein n=1 Tax=Entomophthora muscae TaxID=34485 RepID=A0ACC2UGM6_9FUNG|nr:hypothetical protein DSO57_1006710 [Entomophthora muscae]
MTWEQMQRKHLFSKQEGGTQTLSQIGSTLTYAEIHKYIHPTICPAMAVEWKAKEFTPTEAKQWASIQIPLDLAITLKDMKIHPSTVMDFLNSEYTLDEAIKYSVKKLTIKNAPRPQKEDTEKNMSYSERVRQAWKQS